MQTIGDRIKEKRKELNLTQLELANKLNVTDRAVSKWEQNEGNPDFSLLTSLAEVFKVSLDYLIAGKEPEINLEDMDTVKRAELLAKKDDLEKFIQYRYEDKSILFDMNARKLLHPNAINSKNFENLRKIIVENRSLKIFSKLLDGFVAFCNDRRNQRILTGVFSAAYFVEDYLDDFIIMCSLLGRVDVLDLIKFKWFKVASDVEIDNLNKARNDDFRMRYIRQTNDRFTPFTIRESTLETLVTSKEIKQNVLDYICLPAFLLQFRMDSNPIAILGTQINLILFYLYKNNDQEHIKVTMAELYKNLSENTKGYTSFNTNNYEKKSFAKNGLCSSSRSAGSYVYVTYYAAVPIIDKALDQATKDLNFDMVVIFNDYNKQVSTTLGETVKVLNKEELRLIKIKGDPNSSNQEKVLANYSKYGITNYHSLFGLANNFEGFDEKDPESLKQCIALLKSIYDKYVKNSYICFMEMFEDYIDRKDYKALFQFATDYNLDSINEAVIAGNPDEILKKAQELFTPNSNIYNKITSTEKQIKDLSNQIYRENECRRLQHKLVQYEESLYGNNYLISDMLKWQYSILSFDKFMGVSSFKKSCSEIKKSYLESEIKNIEDQIEQITQEKKRKADLDRVTSEIPFELLRRELSKGNIDNVIIKLCVRLEATLKYKYRYDGDLLEMVDKYVNSHLAYHELHNCYDDEDNNYNGYNKEDEEFKELNEQNERKTGVLHKLRMKRNSIVHAENTNVEMTQREIESCIKIVEEM